MSLRDSRLGLATLGLAFLATAHEGVPPAEPCLPLVDSFEEGALRPDRWLFTSSGVSGHARHDVVPRRGGLERWLRVGRAAGEGRESVVEYVGVVHPHSFALGDLQLEFEVAWEAGRGAEPAALLYLAPVLTWSSPETEPDWLRLAYTDSAAGPRPVLAIRRRGTVRTVAADAGGGARLRAGPRAVRMDLGGGRVRLFEDGVLWYQSGDLDLPFRSAYLYLQMSDRASAGPSDVFYDAVKVRAGCRAPER